MDEPKANQIYKHYKNKYYKIIICGTHTETLERYVIYQSLYNDEKYGNNAIWIRPLSMFLENIIINNQSIKRFELINT